MTTTQTRWTVGFYRGSYWRRLRDRDVFPHYTGSRKSYFIIDADREPSGDHFRTISELETHIDRMIEDNTR